MRITTDWHIHSHNSCECHEIGAKIADIMSAAAEQRITDFGVTDHLHSHYNLPDIQASREEFLALNPPPRFHFGIEVTCMRRWELDEIATGKYDDPVYGIGQDGPESQPAIDLDEEMVETLGIEFVVGGVHWARGIRPEPEAIIRFFHRQNMFLVTHPLVDIVAHPWWWHDHFKYTDGRYVPSPWGDDLRDIPRSYHDEFAAAAVQHNTAVEINHPWLLGKGHGQRAFEQYVEFLAYVKERGVAFALGSDCHTRPYRPDFEAAGRLLDRLGITDDDLWRLPPRLR